MISGDQMLNEPFLITIKDKEYKVEGFTGKIQSAFARFMQKHDLNVLKASKEVIGEEDYFGLLARHLQEVKAGKLDFASVRFCEFVNDDDNLSVLLWYCLTVHQGIMLDDVKEWVRTEPKEAADLFNRLYAEKKD